RFVDVPSGKRQLHFRRIGFAPKSVDTVVTEGKTLALNVTLDAMATEIEGMTVEELARKRQVLADFYDRLSRGFGHFVTRDQIEKRNPMNLSDMMRLIPGARLVPTHGGQATLRFNRATGARDCPPQYWVDGVKAYGFNIDDVTPDDVEGIEIYEGASTIPPQFNTREGTTICGVVLIWTRIPGT
ncbi:MAG TPA: Plug domain-containing protein, partial [Gemmatimonadaceae bacterium]|nr:Plug domain-containing protein [Gemmatimonadaceae bacterium]